MIGIFYLLFFAANIMVGWIGSLYQQMDTATFWLLDAGPCTASAVVLAVLYRPLKSAL